MMDIKAVYSDSEPDGRFILFGYDDYYPAGAMGDAIFTSDDLLEVFRKSRKQVLTGTDTPRFDNLEIYDTEARMEIDINKTLEANPQFREQLLQKETA